MKKKHTRLELTHTATAISEFPNHLMCKVSDRWKIKVYPERQTQGQHAISTLKSLGIEPMTLLLWGDTAMELCFVLFFCSITGLLVSQPDYPGPGDPDRTLPAYNCAATWGGRVPVLPQRLSPARLPLQSSPRSNRDPCRECLFQPEGMHRKHHEVWINLVFSICFFLLNVTLCFSEEIKFWHCPFLPFQSMPWPPSSESHAAGRQVAEELPASAHNLRQR